MLLVAVGNSVKIVQHIYINRINCTSERFMLKTDLNLNEQFLALIVSWLCCCCCCCFLMLGIEPSALNMLGKLFPTELHPQPQFFVLVCFLRHYIAKTGFSRYATQARFELAVLLPQPPNCRGPPCRCASPCPT